MLIIGLTGGLASGKNFVANHLERLKIPVFDADLQVHKLLESDKKIFLQIKKLFPTAIKNGKIDRQVLGLKVFDNKEKLLSLEKIIYPRLQIQENNFIKNCRRNHKKIAVLNVPLLFEKGGYKRCDKTIAVIVPWKTQLQRFQNRFEEKKDLAKIKFVSITKNQINNLQRKNQADFLIYNGLGKAFCYRQIQDILVLLQCYKNLPQHI